MDMTNEKVIEKKVYEDDNRKHDYASKGVAGTALGLGIAGTALGVLPWLTGNGGRSIFGSLGNGMPDNVNINTYGGMSANNAAPTALEVMEKECADEVKLLTDMFGLKLDTANKFYAMRETDVAEKFGLWKGFVEAQNAENRRAMEAEFGLYKSQKDGDDKLKDAMVQQGFGLYKSQRDGFDALNEKKENVPIHLLNFIMFHTAYCLRQQKPFYVQAKTKGLISYRLCCELCSVSLNPCHLSRKDIIIIKFWSMFPIT